MQITVGNAYSGNNGRAAVKADWHYHMTGNDNNGGLSKTQLTTTQVGLDLIHSTGSEFLLPLLFPPSINMIGDFEVTQVGYTTPDKPGKDNNYRGLRIFRNTLYVTKGSGGNGINTLYFVDTTGKACPDGVGLPEPGAPLPTSPLAYDPSLLQSKGVYPYNMCVLQGFPTALKSTTSFPFGLWFANPHTLYVADEGNGDNTYSTSSGTYTTAAAPTTAGLQKWVLQNGSWQLAYTLTSGLSLARRTRCPATQPGTTRPPGCPGRQLPTGCGTSPAGSTRTAR